MSLQLRNCSIICCIQGGSSQETLDFSSGERHTDLGEERKGGNLFSGLFGAFFTHLPVCSHEIAVKDWEPGHGVTGGAHPAPRETSRRRLRVCTGQYSINTLCHRNPSAHPDLRDPKPSEGVRGCLNLFSHVLPAHDSPEQFPSCPGPFLLCNSSSKIGNCG